jgi:8-amino-7-oxononanoate synthase
VDWLQTRLDEIERDGLTRQRRSVVSQPDGWCEVDQHDVRNFATNDYLNLAQDERVIQAAVTATVSSGVGAKASALVCGRTTSQADLEEAIADFEQTEAALVFPSGFAANVGTISALIASDDVVFCERLNHASLVDGCRLSRARMRVYRSDDLSRLEDELQKVDSKQRKWIVTDGVFSMDGRIAPLVHLCDLADRFGAQVIVDEAHGTGVFGDQGRGVCEFTGTEDRVAVRIGTLSKALGTLGGFVAGSRSLIDYLWHSARTQVYSTALPAGICAAAKTALEIVRTEPDRRAHLWRCSSVLRDELKRFEMPVVDGSTGPIIPIIVGDPEQTIQAAQTLERKNYLVSSIRPPTVPQGTSRLRISLSTVFNEIDIRALAVAIAQTIGEQVMVEQANQATKKRLGTQARHASE